MSSARTILSGALLFTVTAFTGENKYRLQQFDSRRDF